MIQKYVVKMAKRGSRRGLPQQIVTVGVETLTEETLQGNNQKACFPRRSSKNNSTLQL